MRSGDKKEFIAKLSLISKIIIAITAIVGLASVILEYGFRLDREEIVILHYISITVVFVFVAYVTFQFIIAPQKSAFLRSHFIESIFVLLMFIEFVFYLTDYSLVEQIGNILRFKNIAYLYVVFSQIIVVIGLLSGLFRYNKNILMLRIDPSRLLVLSFLITIVIGTLLLMLPAATISGTNNWLDAFFTSTSAVCVTGLISVDTATYYSTFGQVIILGLFQIGGLGLMSFTTFFALFFAGGLGIKERIMIHDLLEEENIGEVAKILTFLLIATFLIELAGAALLFWSIKDSVPDIGTAFYISVFHSISAFCNAGFSIFTLNLMDPLVQSNYLFTTTISILIILGGIGFPTILSFWKAGSSALTFRPSSRRFPLQAKIVIYVTVFLVILGGFAIFFTEYHSSMKSLDTFGKIHAAYFQSVTARTAGFNTIDFAQFTLPTVIIFFVLMFIGASPGGTGGGIKTTAITLLFYGTYSIVRDQKNVTIGNRTIPRDVVLRALLKSFLSIAFISLGIFLLALTESHSLTDISFEAFSAFGTVGLSRGITGALSGWGKIIIIALMFIGRVGALAFIFSILKGGESSQVEFPSENISIL